MVSVLLFGSVAQAALVVPFTKTNAIYRRDTLQSKLKGDGLSYNVNFTIGGQDMVSILDTGSSDLWVPATDGCKVSTDASSASDATCEYTFDPSKSNSFSSNQSVTLNITYGDGSAALGYYAQDDIVMGSTTVSAANFALATQASTNSVWGIGLTYGETSYYGNYQATRSGYIYNEGGVLYENFPWQLYRQGITSSAAYSLYLGAPGKYEGECLFGGVDTSKFTGKIYTMPIDLEPISYGAGSTYTYPDPTRFLVNVDSIGMTNSQGKSQTLFSGSFPALLDSGSTISTFPTSVARALVASFGLRSLNSFIGCAVEDGTMDITIRGQVFHIPFGYFVQTLHDQDGNLIVDPSGDVYCSPGISTDDQSPFFIFGDNILSALYLVYDLQNNEIGVAQANTNSTLDSSNQSVLDIGSSGVPSATQASGYSSSITYTISAAKKISFTVKASDTTSISGDIGTRSTYQTDQATNYVETGPSYSGYTPASGSASSSRSTGGAASLAFNGFAALCAALLSF